MERHLQAFENDIVLSDTRLHARLSICAALHFLNRFQSHGFKIPTVSDALLEQLGSCLTLARSKLLHLQLLGRICH